jgi:hypothetical protein
LIPLIALLQDSFQNDTSNYEFKLEILKLLITNLTRQHSASFIRIFENIFAESPNNSIFRKNINPFRVGTIFISVLDDIQLRFAQYIYSCEQLKLTLMK